MLVIPRCESFESDDRRYAIIVKTNFEESDTPIENLVNLTSTYQFEDSYVGCSAKYITFAFPCLISINNMILKQSTAKNNRTWMVQYLNEISGSCLISHLLLLHFMQKIDALGTQI